MLWQPSHSDKVISQRQTLPLMSAASRFEDLNGDGKLDDSDRTFIGSPHPDLTGGLNATLTWKNWDFTMFWNFSIGNDLYNNTKYFTDFWTFNGNKSSRLRDQSWTLNGDNSNAILPMLNTEDNYSGAYSSSYYVEDASFLRLKKSRIGIFPCLKELLKKAGIQNLRLYLQAENIPYDHRICRLRPRVYQRLFTAKRF